MMHVYPTRDDGLKTRTITVSQSGRFTRWKEVQVTAEEYESDLLSEIAVDRAYDTDGHWMIDQDIDETWVD